MRLNPALLMISLLTFAACGEGDGAATVPDRGHPEDPPRVGSVSDSVTQGTSALEIRRADPGHTYAEFRACVADTGEPDTDGRTYVLTNRGTQNVTVEISILGSVDDNWSVHTLRLARLAPGEDFSVQVTFLPKAPGNHDIRIQVAVSQGGNVSEAVTMHLVGRGYDCREEEIPPEDPGMPVEQEPPVLLEPDPDQPGEADGTVTLGGTTTHPTDDDEDDADDDAALITPESLIPPERLAECAGPYTEAVSGWDYDNTPDPVQRLRPAVLNTQSARYANLPVRRATINYTNVPSVGSDPAPAQSMRWSDMQVRSEIERTIRWYADYCILLTFRRVDPVASDARPLAARYDRWLKTLPQDLSMGLGDNASREGDKVLGAAIEAVKRVIPDRKEVTVLFMDRNVGYVGGRLTQGSFVPTGKNFLGIALHGADRDDPYILSHELIHALGNGGPVTWFHNSGDPRSMSRVIRRSIDEAAGLSEARMLDFAEYQEILRQRVVR